MVHVREVTYGSIRFVFLGVNHLFRLFQPQERNWQASSIWDHDRSVYNFLMSVSCHMEWGLPAMELNGRWRKWWFQKKHGDDFGRRIPESLANTAEKWWKVCVLDAILMAWPVARGDFKSRSWMMKKSDLSLQRSTNLFPMAMNHLGSYRKSATQNVQSPYPYQSYIQSPYPYHITYHIINTSSP